MAARKRATSKPVAARKKSASAAKRTKNNWGRNDTGLDSKNVKKPGKVTAKKALSKAKKSTRGKKA